MHASVVELPLTDQRRGVRPRASVQHTGAREDGEQLLVELVTDGIALVQSERSSYKDRAARKATSASCNAG